MLRHNMTIDELADEIMKLEEKLDELSAESYGDDDEGNRRYYAKQVDILEAMNYYNNEYISRLQKELKNEADRWKHLMKISKDLDENFSRYYQ